MVSVISFLLGSDLRSFPIGRAVVYGCWAESSCRVRAAQPDYKNTSSLREQPQIWTQPTSK